MKTSLRLAALAAALLTIMPSRTALADDMSDQFKAHVQKAKVHYDLGEFDDAAEEYIQAYRIKPVAGALFNIAQAYRQAGKYDKSRQFYRSYLREANPDAKSKLAVEKQIRELDELIAKEEKNKRSAPVGVQPALTPGADDLAPPMATSATAAKGPAPKPAATQPPAKETPSVDPDLARAPAPAPAAKPAAPQTAATASAPAPAKPAASAPLPPVAPASPPAKVAIAEPRPKAPSAAVASPAPVHSEGAIQTEAKSGPSHVLAYVTGGAAIALLGGGAFFGVEAARTDNELTAGPHERADADSLISTSKSDHTLSAVLLGVGAAAAVGAGLLYFLPASGPSGGAGASVGGHF